MYPSTFNEIAGIFVYQQVKELQKQGCEVKVVSPVPWTPFPIKYFSKKWKRYSDIPLKDNWEGIEVFYPRYVDFPKALFFASSGKRMYRGVKKIVGEIYKDFKFDIIHSHVALPDGYAGMKLAQEYQKPLIITVHGQDIQQTIFKNERCKKKIEEVINYSKKTIAVSNKLKEISKKRLEVSSDKIQVISNGINIDGIYSKSDIVTSKLENKKIILSVSNLIKIKGIDYNLKAIAKLKSKYPEIIYLIIGDGLERKNLENLAKNLNITNNVKFLGQLSHDKAIGYMSICDIFLLPSWNEAFGVVYIEAMAYGKPVIACKGEGIDGIVRHEETGLLVKSKSIDSVVDAIDFLLFNPKKAKEIGERAKKIVLENYTWQKGVAKIIEIYKDII